MNKEQCKVDVICFVRNCKKLSDLRNVVNKISLELKLPFVHNIIFISPFSINCYDNKYFYRLNYDFNYSYKLSKLISVLRDKKISDDFLIIDESFCITKSITYNDLLNDSLQVEPINLNSKEKINDLCLINFIYKYKKTFLNNFSRWINYKYCLRQNIVNLELLLFSYLPGFHIYKNFLFVNSKSVNIFVEAIQKYNENHFTNSFDIDDFDYDILYYIKLMEGFFMPTNYKKLKKGFYENK